MTAEERALWKEQQQKEAEKRQSEINQGLLTFFIWVLILGGIGGGIWLIWWIATAKKREERRKLEAEETLKAMRSKPIGGLTSYDTGPSRTRKSKTRATKNKSKPDSDDSSLIAGAILGTALSHDDDIRTPDPDPPSSSSDSGSSFDFGGGGSGGGGSTGDY